MAQPEPADPADRQRHGLERNRAHRAPDRLVQVEARIGERAADRQRDVDVAARILHERDDHAERDADPALRRVVARDARKLKPGQVQIRLRIERVAVDATFDARRESSVPRDPCQVVPEIRVHAGNAEVAQLAREVDVHRPAEGPHLTAKIQNPGLAEHAAHLEPAGFRRGGRQSVGMHAEPGEIFHVGRRHAVVHQTNDAILDCQPTDGDVHARRGRVIVGRRGGAVRRGRFRVATAGAREQRANPQLTMLVALHEPGGPRERDASDGDA